MGLREAAFSAGRWTAFSSILVSGLAMLRNVVLARLLVPADFGLMAVAATATTVLSVLVDLGLSQALIHYDGVSAGARSSIYWLNAFLAVTLMLVLAALAPIFGVLYQSPALVPLLWWSGLVFPLAAAGRQLMALAAKALRFDTLAIIDGIAAALAFVVAIVVGVLGGGVYALVAGLLTQAGVSSLLAWIRLPAEYRPHRHFVLREAIPYLGFGGYSVGETLANEFTRGSDVFAGGLVVGAPAMGIYSVPRDLAMKLSMALNSVVTKVGFPLMAKVKGEELQVRKIYLQTMRMTASVNFPLYIFMMLYANEIVVLMYGQKWHAAGIYLQILAAWGLVRSTLNPQGSLLYAVGRTKLAFWWNIAMIALLPPLYWAATRSGGLIGLAVAVAVLQLAIVVPAWRVLVRPCCGASLRAYLGELYIPLACAMVAGTLAWLVTRDMASGVLKLLSGGMAGLVAYVGASVLLNRPWLDAIKELLSGGNGSS